MAEHTFAVELLDIDKLVPSERNPNQGDVGAIATAIAVDGWHGAVMCRDRGKEPPEIFAGEHRWRALHFLQEHGVDLPGRGHVDYTKLLADKTLLLPPPGKVPGQVLKVDEMRAVRKMIADNRASALSSTDDRGLADLLADLAEQDALLGSLFDGDDIDVLLADLHFADAGDELADLRRKAGTPRGRVTRLDPIFTMNNKGTHSLIAIALGAGMLHGVQSARNLMAEGYYSPDHVISFVDNEFKNYDHGLHRDVVAHFRPKYATVRDIMTKKQCDDIGIEFYPTDRILAWAEEIGHYAENVIVIPKFDCLDEIPAEHVLGYSIISAYAATPVPAEKFRGRPVHLLGGAWSDQLRYLELLGDDVVAFDNNSIFKASMFGAYTMPDGQMRDTYDIDLDVTNPFTVAMAISCGHIMRACSKIAPSDAPIEVPEVEPPEMGTRE